MSDNNGKLRIEPSHSAPNMTPESNRGQGRSSPPVSESDGFRSELNLTCLALVEDYRSSKLGMAEASIAIMQELRNASGITDTQRATAYKAFFDQLREHDRATAASARCGQELAQSQPATPRDDRSELDEPEEPTSADVQPVSRKREHDDEGNHADSGKRRVDDTLIPFAQSGDLSGLAPELRQTLQLKENYMRNLDYSKQLVVSNPDVPEFPPSLWKDVLANNFVDLDKVLSGNYSTSGEPKVIEKFGDTGYAFTAGDIKASKSICSHGEWTIAWNSYYDAVVFAYPHRQRELRLYATEINHFFGANLAEFADRVIQFDRAARSCAAKSNRLLLSDIGNFNDLSISHFTSTGTGFGKAPSKVQASGNRGTPEICRRFNDRICTSRTCKFRHTCFTCKARDHSSHACNKAASGSGTQPKAKRK
ncbi:hypothetical protein EWM64_g2544 [Hericium alpestre]|uniref:C3H1-type domain-containing protein n=1 Tax=Hericium alpestre TaxID=135208 RepID=A0A4Z0A4S3_9AGAM|nr:hypothetical protein EWM64_g2544 [Hericium alpestre]